MGGGGDGGGGSGWREGGGNGAMYTSCHAPRLVSRSDDDELMLNVLRCHLTY